MDGRILVGQHNGIYLLLLEGDVRLTLCTAVDELLDRMFSDREFQSVLVDVSGADSIDSTSLGLLAKLSIQADKRFGFRPTLVSTRRDITRILNSMGFEDVFNIVEEPLVHENQLSMLPALESSSNTIRTKVIEAHKILMSLNETNRETFKDLVATLEAETLPATEPPPPASLGAWPR